MLRYAKSWVGLWLVVVFSAASLLGDVTGSVLGNVTDATGAVIQNAKVKATNLETNLVQTTTTDAAGQYRILSLPAGP